MKCSPFFAVALAEILKKYPLNRQRATIQFRTAIHRSTIKCLIRLVLWCVEDQNHCQHHHLVHPKQCAVQHRIHILPVHLRLSISSNRMHQQHRMAIADGFCQAYWACNVRICHQRHPLHRRTLAKKEKMAYHRKHHQPVHQKLAKSNHQNCAKWTFGHQLQCNFITKQILRILSSHSRLHHHLMRPSFAFSSIRCPCTPSASCSHEPN